MKPQHSLSTDIQIRHIAQNNGSNSASSGA